MQDKHNMRQTFLYGWRTISLSVLLLGMSCLSLATGNGGSEQTDDLKAELLVEGLGVPWGLTWWGGDVLLVSERAGRLWRVHPATGAKQPLAGLPAIAPVGQGGLLDIQAYPPLSWQAGPPQWLYLTYTRDSQRRPQQIVTVLARARIDERATRVLQWQDVFETQANSDGGRHFGSRIVFDREGHVFFGVGDRGERDLAQGLDNHAGKVLRLTLDGKVPADNPFLKQRRALPEIYSLGHRNPQGMVFHQRDEAVWVMEHGPRGGDELNRVLPGRNYGWPVISYGKEYWAPLAVGEGTHREGMEQPVFYYDPSIAPGSLLWYDGDAIPSWQHSFLSGALKLTHINQLKMAPDMRRVEVEKRWFAELNERIRSLSQAADGSVFFGTDSGRLYRVTQGP